MAFIQRTTIQLGLLLSSLMLPLFAVALQVSSHSYAYGADIPSQFTCHGRDISPSLFWRKTPPKTLTLAIIMDDPDAPSGTWTHWVVYHIPAKVHNITEDLEAAKPFKFGINSWGNQEYNGPCPPAGQRHQYLIHLYALDADLKLPEGLTAAKLRQAMQGHVLAKGVWLGHYGDHG